MTTLFARHAQHFLRSLSVWALSGVGVLTSALAQETPSQNAAESTAAINTPASPANNAPTSPNTPPSPDGLMQYQGKLLSQLLGSDWHAAQVPTPFDHAYVMTTPDVQHFLRFTARFARHPLPYAPKANTPAVMPFLDESMEELLALNGTLKAARVDNVSDYLPEKSAYGCVASTALGTVTPNEYRVVINVQCVKPNDSTSRVAQWVQLLPIVPPGHPGPSHAEELAHTIYLGRIEIAHRLMLLMTKAGYLN